MPPLPDAPLTREAAIAFLRSEDSAYAVSTTSIRGVEFEVFTNAPNDMREFFTFSNTHFADREFLIYENERLTYGGVHKRAVALAKSLQDLGVRPGDHVAIAMRNYPEYCPAVEAILAVGAVAVTLNSWWEREELEYGLSDSGARFAFVDHQRWLRMEPFRNMLDLGIAIARPEGDLPEGVLNMADLMEPSAGDALPSQPIDTDSDAVIMYTSGSTGHPKGVVLTHRSIISALMGFSCLGMIGGLMQDDDPGMRNRLIQWLQRGAAAFEDSLAAQMPASVMLLNVPLFHVSGLHTMLFMSFRVGRKLVLMYKWSAEKALELAEKESLTSIEGVPTMIGEILNSPDLDKYDLSSLGSIGEQEVIRVDLKPTLKKRFSMSLTRRFIQELINGIRHRGVVESTHP
ncbi:MAG: class I adenylate-forming enzyme family protein, partial [Candidatus Hydrogenedentes bacterium]|nr:class I adenylate-forming enzyme family protein [Candidatus Hydrogenedentota bacterium]